jgi:hypothetical protein
MQARLLADGLPLASSLDEWIHNAIYSKKSKELNKLISEFENQLSTKKSSNVIEFDITDLDKNFILFFLSCNDNLDYLMHEKTNHHIKIYSENSFVDAGYILLNSKSINYYDTLVTNVDHKNIIFEYNPSHKKKYLESIASLKNYNASVKVVSDSLPKFLLNSDFNPKTNAHYYRTYFIDPIAKRQLPFNGFAIQKNDSTELSLTPNSSEAFLQLSAAHENGYWLLLSSGYGSKFYIFKVPDLSNNEISYKLWSSYLLATDGYISSEKDMGYRNLDKVSLDLHLSIECSRLFNWFLPSDSEVMPTYINLLN